MDHLSEPVTYKSLRIRCAQLGTDLTKLCRKAGVNRSALDKWSKQEPKTLVTLKRLNAALELMESEAKPSGAETAQ